MALNKFLLFNNNERTIVVTLSAMTPTDVTYTFSITTKGITSNSKWLNFLYFIPKMGKTTYPILENNIIFSTSQQGQANGITQFSV